MIYIIALTFKYYIYMLKYLVSIILLCLLSTKCYPKDIEQPKFKLKEYSPQNTPDDIAIFDIDGKEHYLEEYEGKTVLLVFWATWCAPCVNEMVDLDILQKDFRKLDFIIIPVSEDYGGISVVKKFYEEYNLRHIALLHDYKNSLFKTFEIVGLPTSILVNHEGKAVATFSGAVQWYDDKVREKLLSYIPNNPVTPKNSYRDRSLNQAPKPKIEEDKATPSEGKKEEENIDKENTNSKKDESINEQKNNQ